MIDVFSLGGKMAAATEGLVLLYFAPDGCCVRGTSRPECEAPRSVVTRKIHHRCHLTPDAEVTTIRQPIDAGTTLGQRQRRWPNVEPASCVTLNARQFESVAHSDITDATAPAKILLFSQKTINNSSFPFMTGL